MSTTKHILLFGAGKSATVLIEFLGKITRKNQWICTVADMNQEAIEAKTSGFETLKAKAVQLTDDAARKALIEAADVVISMMPPALHHLVAKDCLALKKHLLTASYIDPQIREMEKEIAEAGLLFLGEMGLDPGIDHMSAMKMIDHIHAQGGKINTFKSHCGGLVAPESDNNPWHYKISWNPRNVVTAGQAGAVYKEQHNTENKEYLDMFRNCGTVNIKGLGPLAFYPNRDSLSYIPVYGLNEADTFVRTTLRYPDFCTGWQKVVEAGLTSDETIINTDGLSNADFLKNRLAAKHITLDTDLLKQQFAFLGLNDSTPINKGEQPVSTVLQQLIEEKWKLEKGDKDMIVMLHEIEYSLNGKAHSVQSALIVKGDDELRTAMAKTVGLPLGIAATLLLENKITLRGLHIPILPAFYEPVLEALAEEGIRFEETELSTHTS
ncbi:MAG: saccharopine dehydrogenase C-terminal domain-containing protein [Sediminibacterium sp.]|nr:saccharopine dehydrogenase C-terminal domain-containing protein [Sediminibacterium sp.]